ncbi:hypothetical protein GCM10010274_65620 [Streptomyces lavendofoliae]|uniref:Uncharacterized protein n=1 Tax=Streptomyces lavendofoliae TaxID=67314 RepID=A0A918M7N2_9ACTN|nr:hypothetical protein GCM10010274_65620 [Streptomyces lavendofoliae]
MTPSLLLTFNHLAAKGTCGHPYAPRNPGLRMHGSGVCVAWGDGSSGGVMCRLASRGGLEALQPQGRGAEQAGEDRQDRSRETHICRLPGWARPVQAAAVAHSRAPAM